jgi:hypothetical protein
MNFSKDVLKRAAKNPLHTAFIFVKRNLSLGFKNRDRHYRETYSWNFGKLPSTPLKEILRHYGVEIHQTKVLNPDSNDHSLTGSEAVVLSTLISSLRPTSILEIGTGTGFTSQLMSLNAPSNARITTVDLPEVIETKDLGIKIKEIYWNKSDVSEVESKERLDGLENVHRVFVDSMNLNLVLSGPFDFVFIDGCHDYKYVKNDSIRGFEFIDKKGFILWHDYRMLPEVSRFLDELSGVKKVFAIEGTRFVIGLVDKSYDKFLLEV